MSWTRELDVVSVPAITSNLGIMDSEKETLNRVGLTTFVLQFLLLEAGLPQALPYSRELCNAKNQQKQLSGREKSVEAVKVAKGDNWSGFRYTL